MKIFHKSQFIGIVRDAGSEQPWVSGKIRLTPDLPPIYEELFAFLVDDSQTEDPPFAEELLDPTNWTVVLASGEDRGIDVPAIYEDKTIMFRYR